MRDIRRPGGRPSGALPQAFRRQGPSFPACTFSGVRHR